MRLKFPATVLFAMVAAGAAHANDFINGGFETGTAAGWTIGTGDRSGIANGALSPSSFLPGGANYNASLSASHYSIIGVGTVDPIVGTALGSTVYDGKYSMRVEDTVTGGYATVLQQTVPNFTGSPTAGLNIVFAWKAVLEGAHTSTDAATMLITLRDMTVPATLISRQYNAANDGSGVDSRFSLLNSYYYTPVWQIERLTIDASRAGHTFELSVLASDCQLTGHRGYLYVDAFAVPEPASVSLALVGVAVVGGAAARRRRKNPDAALAESPR